MAPVNWKWVNIISEGVMLTLKAGPKSFPWKMMASKVSTGKRLRLSVPRQLVNSHPACKYYQFREAAVIKRNPNGGWELSPNPKLYYQKNEVSKLRFWGGLKISDENCFLLLTVAPFTTYSQSHIDKVLVTTKPLHSRHGSLKHLKGCSR